MFTIKTKIILAISCVAGIVFISFGLFIYRQVKKANIEKIDVRLESLAQNLQDEIDEQYEKDKFPRISKFQKIVNEMLPMSVFRLCDSSGSIVYTDSLLLSEKVHSLKEVLTRKPYLEKIHINHTRYRSLWHQVEVEGHRNYILQVATPLSGIEENLDQLELILWTTIPFALIITALAVYVIVRKAFKPLSDIIETANRISASSLHERIILKHSRNEVAALGIAFNKMIGRIEEAFKSQKQFIADASHEIRTPITIVQSELEFANRSSLTDSAKESIQIALNELEHLRKLAGDLLLLAKLEFSDSNLNFQQVRLDELLADCMRKVSKAYAKKNIDIQLIVDQAVEFTGDEQKLRSAIRNLIENAIKYTAEGGKITLSLLKQKNEVHIIIQDTGVGIAPEDIPNIFKPFYCSATSRAAHDGSGLGLSIVQRIIELHHGTISVESEVNRGSTFRITFHLQ